jgi:tetratricopeptide (TPR) repeat protein
MSNTDSEKNISTQLKAQKQKPQTRAEELRNTLKILDTRIAQLFKSKPEEALEIPVLFDRVDQALEELKEHGMNLASELGQTETLSAQFTKKRTLFIRKIGGSQELAKARQANQPPRDRWWWYVDLNLAEENKQKAVHWLRIFAVAAVFLIILAVIYQKFFAPDPAIRASYGHQQQAENAVMDGNFEYALIQVQQALTYTPEDANLYVLQGVILEALTRPEEARSSFDIALQKYDQADQFYNQRSLVYLMLGDAERALADCETAIQINPDSALSYLEQGQAYETLGDIQKAIDSYETADEIAQKSGNAQLQAVIRMTLSNAYQHIILPTPDATNSGEGE